MGGTPQKSDLANASDFESDAVAPTLKNAAEIAAGIISTILTGYQGRVAIVLGDGTRLPGPEHPRCTVLIRDPGVVRKLVLKRDFLPLVEDYLHGAIEVDGDMEALFDLEPYFSGLNLSLATRAHLFSQALRLPRPQTWGVGKGVPAVVDHRNSQTSIAYHYDVSNDFYRVWLDPEMLYSCAYFESEQQSLAEAQRDKLDYLCRKLRLKPGQTLLDIGCGWGALALWAARHYGARVHGITLSKEQLRHGQARVKEARLEDRVQLELMDYRNLQGQEKYDRVVSVGMFEHVGIDNFSVYFGTAARLLKRGGLFLNHGITNNTGWVRSLSSRFINRYIFPDGELTRISDVCDAMQRAGFELLDIECLRRHYAMTLRHWIVALKAGSDEAIRASSKATYRLWQLYMSGCANYFEQGELGVYQIVAGHQHDRQPLPLRRSDLYT